MEHDLRTSQDGVRLKAGSKNGIEPLELQIALLEPVQKVGLALQALLALAALKILPIELFLRLKTGQSLLDTPHSYVLLPIL